MVVLICDFSYNTVLRYISMKYNYIASLRVHCTQIGKMRFVCQALILILNLHMICANSVFYDLATRMTDALSALYGESGDYAAAKPIIKTDTCTTPVSLQFFNIIGSLSFILFISINFFYLEQLSTLNQR